MLEVSGICKQFDAVTALKDAKLTLAPGEIRALLGANGSGKSTLVKVLGGMVKHDRGIIALDGRSVELRSPRDSMRYGIAVAYQDLSLLPRLSIAENITIGCEPRNRVGFAVNKEIGSKAAELMRKLDINLSPGLPAGRVDVSVQSLVEVAKALARNPRILILDEVTASLHHDQVQRLFSLLRELQAQGLAILFVSHRLDEVFSLCGAATILRSGETAADVRLSDVKTEDVVFHMTGRRIGSSEKERESPAAPLEYTHFLEVENLETIGVMHGASIQVKHGEIVGLGGLQGQGQQEFLRALYGAVPIRHGVIRMEGAAVRFKSPARAVRKGVGLISGDREKEGVFPLRSVAENLFLVRHAASPLFSRAGTGAQKEQTRKMIERLRIIAAGAGVAASSLSGGNQQKLVIGRWLLAQPRLLLLDDPTKGVDVSARSEIHEVLRQLSRAGVAVLLLSSDNTELLENCSRIYVFYEGAIIRELKGAQMNEEELVSSMLGVGSPERRRAE